MGAADNNKLKTIGSFFFIFGFAILTASYLFAYETESGVFYGYGKAIGQFFIFSIFVFLFRWRDKSPNKKPIIYQLGIAWVIAVALTEIFLVQDLVQANKAKEFGQSAIELANSISSGEKILPADSEANNESAETWLRNHVSEMQSIQTEFTEVVSAADLGDMLTPENLIDIDKSEKSRLLVANLINTVTYYEEKTLAQLNKANSTFPHNEDRISKAMYQGFLETMPQGIQTTKQFYEIERNILRTIEDVLELTINKRDEIDISEGYLVSDDQVVLDQFNNYMNRITDLSEQEQQLLLDAQQRHATRIDKMNELLN